MPAQFMLKPQMNRYRKNPNSVFMVMRAHVSSMIGIILMLPVKPIDDRFRIRTRFRIGFNYEWNKYFSIGGRLEGIVKATPDSEIEKANRARLDINIGF